MALVEAGVPFRVVPGVTAGIGGAAYAGIPVTHRETNSVVTFVTGHDASGATPTAVDWAAVAKGSPVIVLYMALKHLGEISDRLLAAGRPGSEPVALIQDATTDRQRTLSTCLSRAAADAEAAGLVPPVVIVIGPVVALRQRLDWLAGLRGLSPVTSVSAAAASAAPREPMAAE